MLQIIPTITVRHTKTGAVCVINECDFDGEVHEKIEVSNEDVAAREAFSGDTRTFEIEIEVEGSSPLLTELTANDLIEMEPEQLGAMAAGLTEEGNYAWQGKQAAVEFLLSYEGPVETDADGGDDLEGGRLSGDKVLQEDNEKTGENQSGRVQIEG